MAQYRVRIRGEKNAIPVIADDMQHDDTDLNAKWYFYRDDELVGESENVAAWCIVPPPGGVA